MAVLVRFGNWLAVLAMVLVLLVAFVLQFARHELPCPLCILQRVAFVLCGFGFLLNLRFGAQPAHYGVAILGALFGLAVSGRQVLLHIVPGDTGYGPPLLGLHLYSWTFVFFAATVLGIALLLVGAVFVCFAGVFRAFPLHDVASAVALPSIAMGVLVLSRSFGVGALLMAVGMLAALVSIVLDVGMPGLQQRAFLVLLLAWLVTVAYRMTRPRP